MHVLYLLLLAACLPFVQLIKGTPLDDYVASVDLQYNYIVQKKEHRIDVTIYTLNMTSQKWLDVIEYNLEDATKIARSTRLCVALLKQIPNQPITFHAVVRAMDTITDCLRKESCGKINIQRFTVAGLSKSGWTAWLAAAVDRRIRAIFSTSYDLLNLISNMKHQYRSYCGWSFPWKSFYDLNMTRQLDTPRFKEIASLIGLFDLQVFNERYENKAMYINSATGDELFMPDDSYYYFRELKGEKYLRLIPNAGHSHTLILGERLVLLPTLTAFYASIMFDLPRPQLSWIISETNATGIIILYTNWEPLAVKCFYAHTNLLWNRRDFRLLVFPFLPNLVIWWQCPVKKVAHGVYQAEMEKPSHGWIGFFIEVTFSIPLIKEKYVLTSEIQILNNTYPCPECYGEQCYGKLV